MEMQQFVVSFRPIAHYKNTNNRYGHWLRQKGTVHFLTKAYLVLCIIYVRVCMQLLLEREVWGNKERQEEPEGESIANSIECLWRARGGREREIER